MGASPSSTSTGGKHNPTKHQHKPHRTTALRIQRLFRQLGKAATLGTDCFTAKGGFTSEEHQKDPKRTASRKLERPGKRKQAQNEAYGGGEKQAKEDRPFPNHRAQSSADGRPAPHTKAAPRRYSLSRAARRRAPPARNGSDAAENGRGSGAAGPALPEPPGQERGRQPPADRGRRGAGGRDRPTARPPPAGCSERASPRPGRSHLSAAADGTEGRHSWPRRRTPLLLAPPLGAGGPRARRVLGGQRWRSAAG